MTSRYWHHTLPSAVVILPHSPSSALPLAFFHPTHVTLSHRDDGELAWSSRDHRKSRHLAVSPKSGNLRKGDTILQGLEHMTRLEYWNISWWVAMAYTSGSILWVANGFVVFLPFCSPRFKESDAAAGWTAWLGATIFEVGSILGILEAWNRDGAANFGWAVQKGLYRRRLEAKKGIESSDERLFMAGASTVKRPPIPERHWTWWSTDKKYWHEIGFLAAFAQLCGATIFWISGFTAIPQILLNMSPGLTDGVFWTPQVVGGTGFIVSTTLLLFETQKRWYKPELFSLGWQIGYWNFVGAIGFTLCGALGYASSNHGLAYESALATFWGGWAFLIGSVIQWYESVNSIT